MSAQEISRQLAATAAARSVRAARAEDAARAPGGPLIEQPEGPAADPFAIILGICESGRPMMLLRQELPAEEAFIRLTHGLGLLGAELLPREDEVSDAAGG